MIIIHIKVTCMYVTECTVAFTSKWLNTPK